MLYSENPKTYNCVKKKTLVNSNHHSSASKWICGYSNPIYSFYSLKFNSKNLILSIN